MFKGVLYLAILTAAVVASWIGFSVYHSYTASTISSDTSIIVTPIPTGFDKQVIEEIKAKKTIRADLSETIPETSTASDATESGEAATASAQL